MGRYVGLVAAVSLLALSGCVTYPYGYNGYGGYGGYSGYGGYPSYGSPYGSQQYGQYGAPYCPPPSGYSYDPYAQPYGYGYGSAPGVVVPAPVPPVVVENPPVVVENPPVVDNSPSSTTTQEDRRRWRQLAREQWRNRHPNSPDPGSTTTGDTTTNTDPTQSAASGDASLNSQTKRQAALERRQGLMGNQTSRTRGAANSSGFLDQTQRSSASMAGNARQQAGTWRMGNQNAISQSQGRTASQVNPYAGAAQRTQMRQSGGMVAAPRMSAASPRPMASGAGAPRAQVSQARPQAQTAAQARRAGKAGRQAPQ